ncbi:uncharacterized protein LOC134764298 [Penaeus indicus]|uniref:uncharacterized protein LOC134764298 n=1 Tax=Penaeus indicus TaxID=29960 RepID=UPI00300CD5C0
MTPSYNKVLILKPKVYIPVAELLSNGGICTKVYASVSALVDAKGRQRWELLDESGNYERWSYRVVTYETMVGSALFGLNENHGEVLVEPVKAPDHYYLQEVYTTYSLHGYLVVRNHGKMHFRREVRHGVRGTSFQQEAFSDCPLLLAPICYYDIDDNRRNFLANLASAFAK